VKRKDMPSIKASEYVKKVFPFEGTIDNAIVANRLRRAYLAGYDAAKRRCMRIASKAGESRP